MPDINKVCLVFRINCCYFNQTESRFGQGEINMWKAQSSGMGKTEPDNDIFAKTAAKHQMT